MTRLLLLDDAAAVNELFAALLGERLGIDVTTLAAVGDLGATLARGERFDVALVDLSFPEEENLSGLDALLELFEADPTTHLVIITQGDTWVSDLLRDAWELLPIATVISKSAPLDYQIELVREVISEGVAAPDPAVQPLLPAHRRESRSIAGFQRLIGHVGHAKLWRALLVAHEPTYRSLAEISGLRMNTIRNYRVQLLPELEYHGLSDPTIRQMREFAIRCRPILTRHIDKALGDAE